MSFERSFPRRWKLKGGDEYEKYEKWARRKGRGERFKGGNGNEISTLMSRNAHNNKKANYSQIQLACIFGHTVLFSVFM